ncbi:ABC transporter permease [Geodermatophilus sabuli]|uniref:ABC transporter permease n=1 Tax=Geodermatophilus sabuli TaxID=1564158 RepID=A0A7K3VZS6_9ACTN|nr:ABC transporter permease [Geodermatophilus sabuli]
MTIVDTGWFRIGARVLVVAALLAGWQYLSAAEILDTTSFPSMTATMAEAGRQLQSADLWLAVWETVRGWGLGLLIGCSLAIVVGTLLGLNRFAYLSVIPVIEFLKTVPVIAILPLAIVVWGATLDMKVFLVAFGVFWPLTIQTIYGVRAVDPVVRDTAAVLRLRGLRKFLNVTLPSAAPFIATGLRVAAAVGLILTIIAELIGGAPGLGLSILTSVNAGPSRLPATYAFILFTGVAGVLVTSAFAYLEQRLLHWHESQRNAAAKAA